MPVLYVASEAAVETGVRAEAWRSYHDAKDPLFMIYASRSFDLLDEGDVERVLEDIEFVEENYADDCAAIALIVIDTLSEAMPGGDEK